MKYKIDRIDLATLSFDAINSTTSSYTFTDNVTNVNENSTGITTVNVNVANYNYFTFARYLTIFFCVISFYLFVAALVYELNKKYKRTRKLVGFLSTSAAFAAFFSCCWQLSELWSCCVLSCQNLRWIYTTCYVINNSFIYAIIWFHQRNLYNDPRLSESKNKCLKFFNVAVLIAIQTVIIVAAGALVSSYKLEQTLFGCVLTWSPDDFYQVVIPVTVVSMACSAIFRVILLILIVYPLLKRINEINFCSNSIIKYSELNEDVQNLIFRLGFCTFFSLFSKLVIDVIAFAEAKNHVDVFVSNIRVLELIINSFFIIFTFVNWKSRLFPFLLCT